MLKTINPKTLKLEKDTFIEDDLTGSYSDVLLSCKFNKQDGYIMLLLEHQSKPEHFMAFRLLRYMVNICSQYLTKHPEAKQLPVILPIYNGKKKYNVPRNIWDLFNNPDLAKSLWNHDYPLINVHEIPDEELKEKIWFGILLYFLKHIHDRQLLKSWQEIFYILPELAKMNSGHDHSKNLLQYSLTFIDQNDRIELGKVLTNNLSKEEGEAIMTSIAQAWKNEGKAEEKEDVVRNMLAKGSDIAFISFSNWP
ncbi:MAG: Rpn family recombination-promoting nuclease/putative transposase [Candidatus Rickettsia vulgarisii]